MAAAGCCHLSGKGLCSRFHPPKPEGPERYRKPSTLALLSQPIFSQAGLAVTRGGWLAAVVGVNLFLPGLIAGFGQCLDLGFERG